MVCSSTTLHYLISCCRLPRRKWAQKPPISRSVVRRREDHAVVSNRRCRLHIESEVWPSRTTSRIPWPSSDGHVHPEERREKLGTFRLVLDDLKSGGIIINLLLQSHDEARAASLLCTALDVQDILDSVVSQ